MNNRSYNQYCGLSYALDIIGDRWTLLIFRELIAGPRRFKDLVEGLPGISTNLLSERLKGLEQQGLLVRRVLPPPAGSTVYALTATGRGLEQTLLELGKWGSQFVPPTSEGVTMLRLGSYALTFKTFFRPEAAQGIDETYEVHIGSEVLQVQIHKGAIDVRQGEAYQPDMVVYTEMAVLLGLLAGAIDPDLAVAEEMVRLEGDLDALHRLVQICGLPSSRPEDLPSPHPAATGSA